MLQKFFVAAGAALVVAIGMAYSTAGAQGEAPAAPSRYGQNMVRSYELPANLIDRYNEAMHEPMQSQAGLTTPDGKDGFTALDTWSGSAFSAVSSSGPYTLVVMVFGSAIEPADLGARWQLSWNGQPGAIPSMDVPDARPGLPMQIAVASEPMEFKVDRQIVPSLKLLSAKNLGIERVRIEVWSGVGEESWLDFVLEWWPMLAGVLMWTALLLFLRYERKKEQAQEQAPEKARKDSRRL
jgi:hypothetical protein